MVLSTGFDLVAYHNLSELVSSCNASDSALDAAWLSDTTRLHPSLRMASSAQETLHSYTTAMTPVSFMLDKAVDAALVKSGYCVLQTTQQCIGKRLQ